MFELGIDFNSMFVQRLFKFDQKTVETTDNLEFSVTLRLQGGRSLVRVLVNDIVAKFWTESCCHGNGLSRRSV